MNREIKFRSKYSDRHPWVFGYFYNNCDIGVNQNIIINFDEDEGTGRECIVSRYFLGQYTGFKDKNGAEVYEGDKVIINTISNKERIVEFVNGSFKITMITENHSPVSYSIGNFKEEEIEVVGNIYDNQKLPVNKI